MQIKYNGIHTTVNTREYKLDDTMEYELKTREYKSNITREYNGIQIE